MVEVEKGVIRPIECMKEGWEIIKNDYWIFFAITLVGFLLGGISMYVLLGAMFCGIYYCLLQKIDGKPVAFDTLWKGFDWWMSGLIAVLIMVVPAFIMMGFIAAPFIASAVMGSKLSESEMMGLLLGGLAIDLVVTIIIICFHTLLMFTFPLIVDRNLGVIAAMKMSAKGVWSNLGGIAGLYGVAFLLGLVGVITCGIGTYFVLPIILAGTAVAYRKIFPKQSNFQQPPQPNFYQGM